MKPLVPWALWFMIAQGVITVGAILGIGWYRYGFRRIAPIAGAAALVYVVGIGLMARFGMPPSGLGALGMFLCAGLIGWTTWPNWGHVFGFKPKRPPIVFEDSRRSRGD